ncbi:arginine--tRNA ligase [Vicingus serpentipes]|uniref:Arginine--tRNA ligase n=1 Tax=Vicingus serpentipes TaxID=1926625 RepID=A0A5C6S0C6_9FLAO|nr:arginine--tRNA ligase [Vicingus serpentipes]TXB67062.1 arginine--tRNA ligase [Vicingus serpentipes]
MENLIAQKVVEGIHHLYGESLQENQAQPQKTKPDFKGDLTVVVFPFLRASKKSPEQTADDLGVYLKENISAITDYNVVKGFLNLSISASFWLEEFKTISTTENFGFAQNSGKTYMVEYSSPNTNKPLHLGHLRNVFLGFSVANILKANGHQVFKTQIINDRGIHICKSMIAWQKYGEGETPESSGMKGDHLVGKYYVEFDKAYKSEINELVNSGIEKEEAEKQAPIFKEAQEMLLKWEQGDEKVVALWKEMNSWVYGGFDVTYKTMGVDFDELYYESDTYLLGKDLVESGLAKGIFYKKEDGSVWCDLSSDKLDDKLVLRADGTSVYMTQDIGTAIERYKNHNDLNGLIYTVGNEQEHHFKVLFAILKKLGYKWAEECYHLSYGMISLPEGKMKSREGTVVDADDLMESIVADAKEMTQERGHIEGMNEAEKESLYASIGLGGLKYFLLKVDPKKGMIFDPKESIDLNGNTGPFIQYAHARIQSLLAKANDLGYSKAFTDVEINEKEQGLIKTLKDYPVIIAEAGKNYSPALLCNYIFDLVKEFNNFYQTVDILREEDKSKLAFRLQLAETVGKVVKSGMNLLGITVPDKM